ncbi:MAG TPA: S9 family peptidase [Gemmatimonadaceae bacterium]|jgi:dipeptidyl aminopeptidase/acylaminoacyl peptidase|nr:S9 family peptidase [Gemmatimonadaceae bacterium]
MRATRLASVASVASVVSAASLVLLAAPGAAQSGRRLAIEDYYRVSTAGSPALSPDGRWVSFTVTDRIEQTNGQAMSVWLAPSDGSAAARNVSGGTNAGAPHWTSDGRLQFTSGIRTVRLDPDHAERSDSSVSQAGAPAGRGGRGGRAARATTTASPDGRWIATVRDFAPPARTRVYESDFEKRHEERFKGVEFDWMDFHRDGQVFPIPNRRDPQLYPPQEIVLSAAKGDSSLTRPLTSLGLRPLDVQWNGDGTRILFTADSLYRDERSYGRNEIWTVALDGKLTRQTPSSEYAYTGAEYSPDGKWILATREYAPDIVIARHLDHGGPVDLVVIPTAGGEQLNLTADWDYLPANPQWSPDGRYVYFTGGIGGTTHVFRVSPNGGPVEQVTTGQRRLGDVSFDRDFTKIVYTVGLNEKPSDVFVANIDGTNERQISHVADAFLREVALSPSVRVQYKSEDGTPIEGWLTLPYGYRENGGKYPLVVSNHGGPHSAIEYGFNFKNQYLAANGYFVLEVNFRSSTGYGEKFLWGTWGAWGTKDGQDVMAGVDYVIGKYPVDPKKVATIGHSYGGFMTNWLITQYPDRFAAAIPGAGIVDWLSDYGNADIPNTKEREFFGSPWDPRAREIMLRQSPLIYANRVKAPTLFINGEIDQRVPFSEAEQMYVALKKNGVPAKMIRYDNMPHGISGSWNNVHRMINERRWLDQWLKGVTP